MVKKNPKIGLIDADLIDNGTGNPNLALMKISHFCKPYSSKLIFDNELNYLEKYDIIIISKVFSFTELPKQVLNAIKKTDKKISELNMCIKEAINLYFETSTKSQIIAIGGTGFFPDGGINLHPTIEHTFPDYHLYDDYIKIKVEQGIPEKRFDSYQNYSIGFTTRGCFRKCNFCVNKKYDLCELHSPVNEFLDTSRPKIYLWDDNVFANSNWRSIFDELNKTGKPFQFRQGLDIRLLDDEKADVLSKSKYFGDVIFAFDHVDDYNLIEKKLKLWRKHSKHATKLYVLCAYDSWTYHEHPEWIKKNQPYLNIISNIETQKERDQKDIEGLFLRIELLMKYSCVPYVMRYEAYKDSEYKDLYVQIARWCNQPNIFKKMSFKEFCIANQKLRKTNRECTAMRAINKFTKDCPEVAKKFFNMKYEFLKNH